MNTEWAGDAKGMTFDAACFYVSPSICNPHNLYQWVLKIEGTIGIPFRWEVAGVEHELQVTWVWAKEKDKESFNAQ